MLEIAGLELLPDWPIFLSFIVAGLALNIVPGADMTFVIAAAARGGRRDGTIAALGIGVGTLAHILAAVLGLSAILASSQTAFNLIKWLGAAYLLWIAVSLLRSGGQAPARGRAPGRIGLAAAEGGGSGQYPQPQGGALLPRLPAPVRRPARRNAGASDPLPRPVVRCGRYPGQRRRRLGRGGNGRPPSACRLDRPRRALARRHRDGCPGASARLEPPPRLTAALRRRRRGRPSAAPRHKPGAHGCARASRSGSAAPGRGRRATARLRAGSSS